MPKNDFRTNPSHAAPDHRRRKLISGAGKAAFLVVVTVDIEPQGKGWCGDVTEMMSPL
jgi:hypothetical protein